MRMARIKLKGQPAVYHCLSRVVGGQLLLTPACREQLRRLMWAQARFLGLEILTYALLSNHFHILVRVPARIELEDAQLLKRARDFYGKDHPLVGRMQEQLNHRGRLSADLRQGLLRRMGEVSQFMKELKQAFSRWYNQRHDRFGTLWAERFTSLVVQPDNLRALETVARYIDLNPVRAGLVADPKDYRFCGYGEAVAGNREARAGLMSFQPHKDWKRAGAAYRQGLFVRGAQPTKANQRAIPPEQVRRVMARGGKLEPAQVLRVRVRYLGQGVALGSRNYVEGIFVQFRDRFGKRRKTGARPLRGLPFEDLCTLRDLRKCPVG